MTIEEFKKRWESDDEGGGITFDDIAECAKAWGISATPRTERLDVIREKVLAKAGIED